MLDPLLVDEASDGAGAGQAAAAGGAEGAAPAGEEKRGEGQIQRAILRAEAQWEPLPEHVDARGLQPALKLVESVGRDPVLAKALLSLQLLKPDDQGGRGAKKGGGARGRKGGGGKAGSARPRLYLQQELAHLLSLGVANRSLQTVLLGLKALLTLYEATTAVSGGPVATPQQQQQQPPAPAVAQRPPPELPQCGPVLKTLARVLLPVWKAYLALLEEEEAGSARAVGGK